MNTFGLTFERLATNLFGDPSSDKLLYSDGACEEESLLATVCSVDDLSSLSWQLQNAANSWPGRYHFSVHRGAIVRCLPFAPSQRVLELGAGCGAITRALGERFQHVDAIEGALTRARICAKRCEDLLNVQVFAADIAKLIPAPEYDLVFLVGVLEWSQGFIPGSNPFHRCLQIALRALKDSGSLVVAIENQLGLKYFLGSGEDHSGAPMEGLHGYPTFAKAKTFSRFGLTELLKEAGFQVVRFLYPFPDYKFARVILTDEAVDLKNDSVAYWASRHSFEDYQKTSRYIYGNRILMANEIAKAGLLNELSNSFLVVAGKQSGSVNEMSWVVWSERVAQNMPLISRTTLERGDNHLIVKKVYPYVGRQQTPDSAAVFSLNPEPEQPFFDGSSVEVELLRCAISGRSNDFVEVVRQWSEYVHKYFTDPDGKHICSNAWDCIPRNLIRLPTGQLAAFDLEFVNHSPFTLQELCARGLLFWFCDHAQSTVKLYSEAKTIREKIAVVLSATFPSMEPYSVIQSAVRTETNFQLWVNPQILIEPYANLDVPVQSDLLEDYIALQLCSMEERVNRLQRFSDTVRQTLAYRFYRRFIRPLRDKLPRHEKR
jgi:Trans-aconitate methyltransferase